jgi:hypothetical protein
MTFSDRSVFALLLACPTILFCGGCCVTPPTAEEILDLGFRSPELCFRTFQAGWRGNLPRLELRCFSQRFKSDLHLSHLAYLEYRDRELASNPWFRKGVADAKILASESLGEGRHLLLVASHGHGFEVELVREEFWQLWSNETLLADELLPPGGISDLTDVLDDDPRVIVAGAKLPADLDSHTTPELRVAMTEFRIGYEWKIDRIEQRESSTEPPSTPDHTEIEP